MALGQQQGTNFPFRKQAFKLSISLKNIDNRQVVEVLGREIVLSSILSQVENELSKNTNIEEVRFIAGTLFTIDANLEKEVWHGRNVVVYAKEIVVRQPVHWNVSGKDSGNTYKQKAGTAQDGSGLNGGDGNAGESGGNVMIIAKRIQSGENLTFSANGGNGSNGQDGGDGKAGKDGKGISTSDFDSMFPTPSSSVMYKTYFIENYKSLAKQVHTVKREWAEKGWIFKNTYTSDVLDVILEFNHVEHYDSFYEGTTADGHEITFSCESNGAGASHQILLLYRGTHGTPGKSGGEYGSGGKGGRAGEVNIVCLESNQRVAAKIIAKTGADGMDGKGGVNGRHGKKGWDMGYMDVKKGMFFCTPVYYGRDKNSSLKIDYYKYSADDRVMCPYEKDSGYPYAGITVSRIENKNMKTLEERNNSRSNKKSGHSANAVGKKIISRQRILNTYSDFMNTIEAEIQAEQAEKKRAYERQLAAQQKRAYEEQLAAQLAAEMEMQQTITTDQLNDSDFESLMEEISDVQNPNAHIGETENNISLQQNDKTFEETFPSSENNREELDLTTFSIKRNVPFQLGMEHELRQVKITVSSSCKNNVVENFIPENDAFNLDAWVQLKTFVIDFGNLKQLIDRFNTVKQHFIDEKSVENTDKIRQIEQMLVEKYKLTALHALATDLEQNQEKRESNSMQIQNVSKYLVETKAKNSVIAHATLGTMKQYVFENTQRIRDNIATFVEQEMMINSLALNRAVKAYVLETAYSDLANECLENLQNELKKPQHKNISRFWDALDDRPLEHEVREMIEKDSTLKQLYERWNEVKRQALQYESDELSVDEDKKNKFITHIRSKGVKSKSCRELLAYVYDVNLRVYDRDDEHELILCEDHNTSSNSKNHILSTGSEFVQLAVNEEYLQLAKERLQKDKIYAKTLCEMNTLKINEEINNYLEKRVLSTNNLVQDHYFDEKTAPATIASYFPIQERDELKSVLENLEYEHSKQKGILQHMLLRFSHEGKHISFNEMCFFINAVLDNFADADQEEYTFAWIVAAYSQCNWLDEVLLLQLETYFEKQLHEKQQWREYLGKIQNKQVMLVFATELQVSVCSVECIDEILRLFIQSIHFDGIPLTEWGYFLKEHYWMDKLRQLLEWSKKESLEDATYYIRSVENIFGDSKANAIIDSIKRAESDASEELLLDILINLHKQKWKLTEEDVSSLAHSSLQEWASKMEGKYKPNLEELRIGQLAELIENDEVSSDEIIKHLPEIRTSIQKITDKKLTHNQNPVASFTEQDITMWVDEFRDKMNNNTVEFKLQTYETMLAVIDRAIEIKRGFRLRDTQRLSVLILLTNERSTLAQVSTGEGKSLIVVALSLMKALLTEKVDIVTSSPVLAKRDSEMNKDIYELFDINVSHNCSDNIEDRKEAYSMHQVVYGDLANFQRDYLLDRFYGKNILGDRDFTNVIVDEVDSMLLDKGNNMLYLSHDIPGMDKLESVYIFIWQMVNNPTEGPEDIDIDVVEKEVLSNLYHSIGPDDLMQLDSDLSSRKLNIIWNSLVDAGILNDEGHIITDIIDPKKLEEILTPETVEYKHRLSFLLKQCVDRENLIKIPNCLKKFVERHLSSWIASAINALLMVPGQSYVVDYKIAGSSSNRDASIIILDNDTGADQGSSQWDEALHQFLQLKHGCKLSTQSLKAVFVSNVTYFKMYKLLYGLTGTLGSQRERNLLKDIHQVAFVTIPTAKSKQFEEYKPIISCGYKMWLKHITIEVNKLINEEQRSVLIICDTINDADGIHKALKGKFPNQIHCYTRDYQEFDIVQGSKELQQGQIIIATNLAGRGTDIRITHALKQSGGLHVMLTYLPDNIRIEEQAFGRAARSGDKGSGQLIISVSSQRQHRRSKIIKLKKERDENELYRISDIRTYYEKTIKAEEICFEEFKEMYEKHRKSLDADDVPSEVKTILLQNLLDQWSFWLDEYSGSMEDIMQECDERKVPLLLKKFVSKLSKFDTGNCFDSSLLNSYYFNSKRWKVWVEGNPMQMIKLANYLSETYASKTFMQKVEKVAKTVANAYCNDMYDIEKEVEWAYETAMSLYDDVIKCEPEFSEAAHYYRAYILMKSIQREESPESQDSKQKRKHFMNNLSEAMRLFEDHHAFALQAASIVTKLKGNNVWHDGYQAQKDTISQLYQTFIRSIQDIFGHAVTASTFVTEEIKENVAQHIFLQLIDTGVISRPKVRKTISEQQLYKLHNEYGISMKDLRQFLSKRVGTINEETFIQECKASIPLPSREQFWQTLIDQKVLNCVKKYATVDIVKLEAEDPSLKDALDEKIANKTLIKKSLAPVLGQIVLYHEELSLRNLENNDSTTITNSVAIFEQENFKTLIGREKFEMMIRKGIIKCNEMGNVDKNQIALCEFKSFDSISIEDIVSKTNIAKGDAELIVEELINRNVLERKEERLTMKESFDASEDELLPSYPVYESTVRGLLSSCFAYRLALNNITEQLQANHSTDIILRIQLTCNPYPQFFQDLLNQNIIRPYVVKEADFKEILNKIFNSNKCYKEVDHWFRSNLHISTVDSERLFEHVVITPLDMIGDEITEITNIRTDLLVRNTTSGMRFIPTNIEKELLQYDMRKTVEQFFVQLDIFFKKETKSHLEGVLGQMKSSLIGLKVPSINLKFIRETGKVKEKNFGTIEEDQLFILNGLQHFLQLEEKKWSKAMLLNVGLVVGIGFAQIVTGAIMEIYSAGALTHVASGVINEGVNDIMYAVSSFNSGYFSWQDYRKEKIKSVIFTAATAGVGALASRGTKVSRIGYKVAGPGITQGGEISKLTGSALIKSVGGKKVFNETVKRIVMKTAQGFAQAATSAMVDKFTDDYLQAIINSIAADVLSQMASTVDNHKISQTLRKIYDELGEPQARKLISQLSGFESNDWETCISYTKQLTSSLSQGFASAMQKTQTNSKTLKVLSNISTAWDWTERAIEIGKLTLVAGTFLDKLDAQMNEKFKTMVQSASLEEQSNESNFETFRTEIASQWKSQLSEHVGRIISQYLVKPLLNDALTRIRKFVKRIPHNVKRIALKRKMKRLKEKYDKAINAPNTTEEMKENLKKDYHAQLKKIMYKTKSPSLFAKIIQENVPMDLTCAAACVPLIHHLLGKMGFDVKGIVLTVQAEQGAEQSFCSGSVDENSVRNVVLQLKDNHFTCSGNELDIGNNNCLFAALSEAIPELRGIRADDFRKQIADTIKHEPSVQHRIRQGWHRFPIKKFNAIGGKAVVPNRRIKMLRKEAPLRAYENKTVESLLMSDSFPAYLPPENCPTAKNPPSHLYSRVTIFNYEIAGVISAAMKVTGLSFDQIIDMEKGASTTQDDLPVVKGGEIHRAHTTRGTIKSGGDLDNYPEVKKKLQQYFAHCEYVCKEANDFRKIGGWIDKRQMLSIQHIVNTHDFSKDATKKDVSNIKTHLKSEMRELKPELEKKRFDNEQRYMSKTSNALPTVHIDPIATLQRKMNDGVQQRQHGVGSSPTVNQQQWEVR
ncbi:uncharacterized protein LOC128300304 [Anopheles moucheti]|uniref:uncharacterized protein LOC128300304 n=1 Tax=Anopheles moucheti TaxID=186751 RepID=UPI0022F13DF8|nr:uncharacterized protein LOC128300304 [Anopheles moucheti]